MKKKNSSKNNKNIAKLKLEMKELELENERLRENNTKLRVQNIQISKQAYKWYHQKRTFKTKYQRLKVLHTTQASIDPSSPTREMSEDQQQQYNNNFVHENMQGQFCVHGDMQVQFWKHFLCMSTCNTFLLGEMLDTIFGTYFFPITLQVISLISYISSINPHVSPIRP